MECHNCSNGFSPSFCWTLSSSSTNRIKSNRKGKIAHFHTPTVLFFTTSPPLHPIPLSLPPLAWCLISILVGISLMSNGGCRIGYDISHHYCHQSKEDTYGHIYNTGEQGDTNTYINQHRNNRCNRMTCAYLHSPHALYDSCSSLSSPFSHATFQFSPLDPFLGCHPIGNCHHHYSTIRIWSNCHTHMCVSIRFREDITASASGEWAREEWEDQNSKMDP